MVKIKNITQLKNLEIKHFTPLIYIGDEYIFFRSRKIYTGVSLHGSLIVVINELGFASFQECNLFCTVGQLRDFEINKVLNDDQNTK